MERFRVAAGDGRRLDVEVDGPDEGEAVLFHVGTPSAGVVYPELVRAGATRGLRHVSYSRPGYAASDRLPERSVADCIADVEAITDELGIERFYAVGWSGGGPHALACAALLPERTIAAATLASVAPYDAVGLDWLAGMGEENIEEFAAARAGEEALLAYLQRERASLLAATGEDVQAAFGDLISQVDASVFTGEFADYMAAVAHGALAEGVWGWLDDDVAFLGDWGFDLATVERPVAIWQGSEDRFVPYAHGQWLAVNVAGAQARLLDGEGHLSILLGAYGRVLDELVAAR
jgi:pimeloyl-ACP methyl ester carboxylesterase